MNYLVLVSHGGFAQGLKTSLAMFAADKMDQVIAVGLENGQSVDEFALVFREAVFGLTADDSVVVLADIVGGSPLTTALGVLEEKGLLQTATVLGGMNLPMAMTAMMGLATMDLDSLKQMMLQEGKSGMSELVVPTDDADDEDDDI